jgi:hypothetical protein
MKIAHRLQSITRLFLDSAPVIYFVEKIRIILRE